TVRPALVIDGCKGCGACMKLSCPAIERRGKEVVINPALCIGCGMCAQVCPFKAIKGVQA
ncbi:MAG: 4Fe-4S dicluster domain-containing protein, partial [Eubacteriales bacterium]|nr:4Fe-4S dicluster domain-containing protein [Eubacteriales bacterium]